MSEYEEDKVVDTSSSEVSEFEDLFFDGIEDELPDDPWALLEGSELTDSNQDDLIKAVENEEDIDDMIDSISYEHVGLHGRDKDVEDMFEDDLERQLAILIKVRVHEVCHVNTLWPDREKALSWIFCSTDDTQPENDFLSFTDTTSAFQARTEVLQARIQHQLYRYAIALRSPLPWTADEPPSVIEGELASSIGGENAINMLRVAWLWPGMRLDLLKEQVEELWIDGEWDIDVVLDDLIDHGYIGIANGFVYGICRNPELKAKGGTFIWSEAL